MRKKLVVFSLIVTLISGIIAFQAKLTSIQGINWKKESITYLPANERVKGVLLGFETTAANYLWIRSVLYFGDHYITDQNYEYLINMVDMVTRLNPHFYPAYEFAGLMIPDLCNNPGAARVILERGIFYLGAKRWNPAFYLGMIYYKYYGDRKQAAYYFALAAQAKGAPVKKLASLASLFYNQTGNRRESLSFLSFLYETSESFDVRNYLLNKLTSEYASGKSVKD
jgi:hypothetical protein